MIHRMLVSDDLVAVHYRSQANSDGYYAPRLIDEPVPCFAAQRDDFGRVT